MNFPTLLTASRIIIAPFFAYAFVHGYAHQSVFWIWTAVALLVVSELTDAVDGSVARSRRQVTDFGKVFDPVADSISRLTAILSFLVCGIIPLWLFLVFFYRDSLLSLLRIVCASRGTVLAARQSGKAKAVLQAAGIFSVLAIVLLRIYDPSLMPSALWGFHPGFWVMLVPALVTVLSVFDYVMPNREAIVDMMRPKP
jgi:CDP-diacylglycerol---glycerol-3-phosphate 3-phosphatidyltransferase